MHPALSEALAKAHIENLRRAAALRRTVTLAHRVADAPASRVPDAPAHSDPSNRDRVIRPASTTSMPDASGKPHVINRGCSSGRMDVPVGGRRRLAGALKHRRSQAGARGK